MFVSGFNHRMNNNKFQNLFPPIYCYMSVSRSVRLG